MPLGPCSSAIKALVSHCGLLSQSSNHNFMDVSGGIDKLDLLWMLSGCERQRAAAACELFWGLQWQETQNIIMYCHDVHKSIMGTWNPKVWQKQMHPGPTTRQRQMSGEDAGCTSQTLSKILAVGQHLVMFAQRAWRIGMQRAWMGWSIRAWMLCKRVRGWPAVIFRPPPWRGQQWVSGIGARDTGCNFLIRFRMLWTRNVIATCTWEPGT